MPAVLHRPPAVVVRRALHGQQRVLDRHPEQAALAVEQLLDVVQQDRDGLTLRRWSLSRAWPVKFVAGEWDNESDENIIESVTLTYDFFELVQ